VDELDPCERRVGTVLRDKWTLERLIGVGGMAAVYVARHKIGRLDAIKILHPEYARSDQIRARFEQEAHVLNRFRHPGAVEVRDLETTEDGAPFLVMELLEGQPLSDRLRESPQAPEEALRVADEVLDVLAAAHAQGIIHRDIKPDNLFVLPSGAIKVLDFGIAQLRSNERNLKTRTGTTLGTVAYMPPEQLKGLDIDARADVYGVGATMFRMLVGRTPHRAQSDVELMMMVLSEPAPRLATVLDPVREDVARIVDRAIAFDRDARFPDARAMQTDVRVARAEKSAKMAAPLPPQAEVATRVPAPLPAALAAMAKAAGAAAPVPSAAPIASAPVPSAGPVAPVASAAPVAPASAASGPHGVAAVAAVAAVAPAIAPTLAAAPESSLLREAAPQSRLVTRAVTAPVIEPAGEPARVSGADVAAMMDREVAGVPLVWLLAAAVVVLFVAGALVAALAIGALRARDSAAAMDAGPTTAATAPTATAPLPTILPPPDDQGPFDEPPDEPHDEHHGPHHHGPPHGHGKHHPPPPH
jgi:predicted Ser/Thr protein kinase